MAGQYSVSFIAIYCENPVSHKHAVTQGIIKKKLRGFSPQANYTDQATSACDEVSANF
jgi:hypothetical protein